jgi:ligand-binding sensor domain-containing protein
VVRYPNLNTTVRPPANYANEINGLPHPQVKAMAELDGKVYVATWGGGLGVYDIGGDSWTQIRAGDTGLTNGFIADLAVSPTEDKLYLASNDGVFVYAPSTQTWTHVSTIRDIPDTDPQYFLVVRLQSTISSVAVTEAAGIVQRWYAPRVEIRVDAGYEPYFGILVSKNTNTEYKYSTENSGLVERNVNDIFYDAVRGTYWVSYVTQGVSEVNVDTKTWTDQTVVQGLPSNTVYNIVRASDGSASGTTLWAATQAGLAKLNGAGTKWQGYGRSAGLPGDRVRVVYSDDGKRLWAGFVDGGAAKIKP